MEVVQNEVVLYGLDQHQGIIDQIIQDMRIEADAFDVKLILVEAVTNAYLHGNLCDCKKPISIRYILQDGQLHLQVQDCGDGTEQIRIPETIDPLQLLEEGGRGLYLIRCCSDRAEMIRNTMFVSKRLKQPQPF
ncbi:ATP-binding protein [Paenibacillus donghaensis]|uniref:Histidine kinase/HSP90-like ATPase domain-containing protein n=1 Tax=Paenibacillus donghaensis TaxID=414771 RepID=A0A2Z2KNL7_9BACL|nr:ATP-binding protein [Paenibacillus donghaensis]ASA22802.1 hypothetical protein B9T62_19555 [Paenibacillus donghaensis]